MSRRKKALNAFQIALNNVKLSASLQVKYVTFKRKVITRFRNAELSQINITLIRSKEICNHSFTVALNPITILLFFGLLCNNISCFD